MRFGTVQCTPSSDVISRRSLVPMGALQRASNRQSGQTTYTLPDLSTSAEGRAPDRMPPGSPLNRICAPRNVWLHVKPPSVDLNERTAVSKQSSMGTITVPLGCTTGCPPMTQALSGVVLAAPHLKPPSVDVRIWTKLSWLLLSYSV